MAVLSTTINDQNGGSFGGIPGPYGGFALVLFSENTAGASVADVTTCVMYPCVKTYNVSVTNGSLVMQEQSSWYSESGIGIPYNQLSIAPVTFNPPAQQVSNTTTNRTFSLDSFAASTMVDLLQDSFNGSSTFDMGNGWTYTSDYMQALSQTADLGQMMDKVADSLSNYIRNSSSTPYYGTAWDMESYVHVRWDWLILPMTLAPAALLFLLSAIWLSSHWDIKVWKSSSLATIFHGLEHPIETINLNRQSEMDELSRQFHVKLQQASDKTHNLVLIGSPAAQFHRGSLSPAAAGNEFEHAEPPHPAINSHETWSEDVGRHRIPRRPVGSSQPPRTGQSRSTGSMPLENRPSGDAMRGEAFGLG